MATGDRDSGEVYSWDRGQKGAGTAGMVKLVRWPSGTGTAEEYIAGTAPRGWDSKLECYGFIGGGCYDYGLHVDTWGECRLWFEARFVLSLSG